MCGLAVNLCVTFSRHARWVDEMFRIKKSRHPGTWCHSQRDKQDSPSRKDLLSKQSVVRRQPSALSSFWIVSASGNQLALDGVIPQASVSSGWVGYR